MRVFFSFRGGGGVGFCMFLFEVFGVIRDLSKERKNHKSESLKRLAMDRKEQICID